MMLDLFDGQPIPVTQSVGALPKEHVHFRHLVSFRKIHYRKFDGLKFLHSNHPSRINYIDALVFSLKNNINILALQRRKEFR